MGRAMDLRLVRIVSVIAAVAVTAALAAPLVLLYAAIVA